MNSKHADPGDSPSPRIPAALGIAVRVPIDIVLRISLCPVFYFPFPAWLPDLLEVVSEIGSGPPELRRQFITFRFSLPL